MADPSVLIHCNAGPGYGMGHLMRSLALAEEARSRGWRVEILGVVSDSAVTHARRIVPEMRITAVPADLLRTGLERAYLERPDVVHFDTYWDVPAAPTTGTFVSNMQDGRFGVRPTTLAIDANLGAERWFARPDQSRFHLVGAEAVLIRQQVLRQREASTVSGSHPRVLVALGGTDERELTQVVVEALCELDTPIALTIVCPVAQHKAVNAAITESRHSARVESFLDDLPAVARRQDFIVSAAGTSVWDFAYMGIPMALLCVEENQAPGYRAAVEAGLGVPLGEPPHDELVARIHGLQGLLTDGDWLRERGATSRRIVDGLGVWRVVSAWEEQSGIPSPSSGSHSSRLTSRPATSADARMLFEWRNDESTRANSRSREEVSWAGHVTWLDDCIADPERRLFIVDSPEGAVATVRWDRRSALDWEVSITVAPEQRGRGWAREVLTVGETALDVVAPVRLLAGVHSRNVASRKLFVGSGYLPLQPADASGFEMRAKWRLRGEA